MTSALPTDPVVQSVDVVACRIPTDAPESDATLAWDSTTVVIVEIAAGDQRGVGWTYCDECVATLVRSTLAPVITGRDVRDVAGAWDAMQRAVRNIGRPGVASCAISAVDIALWDLASRLHGTALVTAVGGIHTAIDAYGSGGFTSYSLERLGRQLAGWVAEGFTAVKMKVGRAPTDDMVRVSAARDAVGDDAELFVDANGAFGPKQAAGWADRYAGLGVTWFEEPVTSDDLDGLRDVRLLAPASVEVAAGEYGYDEWYVRRMLEARTVDCLQLDVTRCGGITGFLRAGRVAESFHIDVSTHTAPQLSVHAACALRRPRHLEWFHDHVRIERMLFEGSVEPENGRLRPDRTRPGHGMAPRRDAIEQYAT